MSELAMAPNGYDAADVLKREAQDFCALPTSFAQERLWSLDRVDPGNPRWNLPVRFGLKGALDLGRLQRAVNEIVRRHEVLRTTLRPVDGQLAQVIAPSLEVEVPVVDLTHFPQAERSAEADRMSLAEARRSFDLAGGPLLRVTLLRIGPDRHLLLVTPHHSVADYWSVGLISNELGALYEGYSRGLCLPLPELALQYGDFAVWQRQQADTSSVRRELQYWKDELENLPLVEFPCDYPRSRQPAHDASITSLLLPVELGNTLKMLAAREGTTFFNTALAAFASVLNYYTGQTEFGISTQVAGRVSMELEALIGLFINTIVLRMDLSGDPPFRELLARVTQVAAFGITNQNVRFEQVLKELRPREYPEHDSLFRVNFICQRDPVKPLNFSGVELTAVPSKSQGALYDLNVFLVLRNEGWRLACEYNKDLFRGETIKRLLTDYLTVLERIVEDPAVRLSNLRIANGAAGLGK